jgi:rhodanese-related sulfurtransferase
LSNYFRIAFLSVVLFPTTGHSNDGAPWVSENIQLTNAGDCCGVYAIGAAIESFGIRFDARSYLNSKFTAANIGTSADQLRTIAGEHGLVVIPFKNLNIASLQTLRTPALLNLRGTDYSEGLTGHWIAYFGMTGNRNFLILDTTTSKKLTEVSASELNANWRGDAMILSTSRYDGWSLYIQILIASLAPSFVTVAMAIAAGVLFRNAKLNCVLAFNLTLVILLATSAMVEHPMFLDEQDAINWIDSKYHTSITSRISDQRFHSLVQADLEKSKVVFVDARFREDFNSAHLRGSVSIPVNITLSEFADIVSGLPTDRSYVVYCAGPDCGWDDIVANRLVSAKFRQVFVYEGGVAGLRNSNLYELSVNGLIERK